MGELGEFAVENGTKTYIGYKAGFMIIRDPTRESTPHTDKNALPFKRASAKLINALTSGIKVRDAIQLTKDEYETCIRSYGTSQDDPFGDAPLIRFALTWDYVFLDALGDLEASF